MLALFSPNGGIEARIVLSIGSGFGDYLCMFAMYQSENIHNALLQQLSDGSQVYAIFDRRQQFLAEPRIIELMDAGAICLYDKHEKSVRSQYIITPDTRVLTGSYLYTYTSEYRYADVYTEIDYTPTWVEFSDDWQFHYAHSELIT